MTQPAESKGRPLDISTLLLMNVVPIIGVLVADWDPALVFVFYAMETIIAGVFNIPKLMLSAQSNPDSAIPINGKQEFFSGLGLAAFFTFHYGFFVFVQLTIFFGIMQIESRTLGTVQLSEGVFSAFTNIKRLAGTEMSIILGTMGLSYMLTFIRDYVMGNKAHHMTPSQQMAEPYSRIIVQQFVVILFGFIAILQAGSLGLLIIFVIVKSATDIIILQKGKALLNNIDFGTPT